MDVRMQKKQLRKVFGRAGWALLIYYLIMNACVLLVTLIDTICYYIKGLANGSMDNIMEGLDVDRIMGNAWGYILACVIGLVILLLWKGKKFCFQDIWVKGKPMGTVDFIALLCISVGGQWVFQIVGTVMELILNMFGLSALVAMETASMSADTFSMYLYGGFFAPIVEEILFRGLIMRSFQPYGKKFAILTSAFLFGMFHGNIIQTPFSFFIGLILGYVAMEYSILWAMVLHMFNNLVLADMLNRLTKNLPEFVASFIFSAIILSFTAAGVIFAIVKHKQISAYFKNGKMHPLCTSSFFTSPGILVITALMFISMLLTITPL